MMAAIDQDDELPPEIAKQMESAGIAPEIATLKELIASIPSLLADRERVAALEREVEQRRVQWPLTPLLPIHVSPETGRKCAERGELAAQKIGGRWFSTVSDVENWLRATGRWFKTEEAERKWRAETRRFSQGLRA
jgi:hypothetical protein